jgi:hypothetical protein
MVGKVARRADPELGAINTILNALDGLEGESIQRVLDYVIGRLSLGGSVATSTSSSNLTGAANIAMSASGEATGGRQRSIRDLKEEKNPTSSNQMTALVAYYLSEVAPSDERKSAINATDLQKYFKQAGFRLPKLIRVSLTNAAAAGYFDAVGNGQYRLNPVGYNLIAHGLPRGAGTKSPGSKAK